MNILALLLAGTFLLAPLASGVDQRAEAAGPPAVTGAVISTARHGSSLLLIVRSSRGRVVTAAVAAKNVVTAKGGPLSAQEVLVGDRVSVLNGRAQDLSQWEVDLQGILAVAPLSQSDPIIVQLKPAADIIVDVDSSTHYVDRSGETSMLDQLADADIVVLHGVYDATAREMTRTDTLTRLGPVRRKPGKAKGSHT